MIEKINEVCEARKAVFKHDEGEDEVEFDGNVASVASQVVSQNGGSKCDQEDSTEILKLRLQLELARAEERKLQAEKKKLQAEREMMRERVELVFRAKRLEMLVHLLQSLYLKSN